MHFLPTSSPPKMHFPSDLKSLHNCQIRLRQLTRREHKAVLRPSNQEIDTQLSSPLQLISSSLWSWSTMQISSPLQLIYSPLQLVYLAVLPPLATDLFYLQPNSPATRQSTDFPCSRSLTQQRQAETWSTSALTGACQRTREPETEMKVNPVLWKVSDPQVAVPSSIPNFLLFSLESFSGPFVHFYFRTITQSFFSYSYCSYLTTTKSSSCVGCN